MLMVPSNLKVACLAAKGERQGGGGESEFNCEYTASV